MMASTQGRFRSMLLGCLLLLTTDAIVSEIKEEKETAGAGAGGGGGMY